MKIVWATDLHLCFVDDGVIKTLIEDINNSKAEAFIIAGDISESDSVDQRLIEFNAELNMPVYFVLGNHDFYNSSIYTKSKDISQLCKNYSKLNWLSELDFIKLTDNTALIGHEGWYDTREGNIYGGVLLNDFRYIQELSPFLPDLNLISVRCKELADDACSHIKKSLELAINECDNIIMATHVPPFKEAAWHMGKRSGSEYLPWYSSKIMGMTISKIMEQNKDKNLTILCGHTHGGGTVDILPNLKVITGEAEYFCPEIQEEINVL